METRAERNFIGTNFIGLSSPLRSQVGVDQTYNSLGKMVKAFARRASTIQESCTEMAVEVGEISVLRGFNTSTQCCWSEQLA